jgi:hypothetical protein
MKNPSKMTKKLAATGAFALILATSAFADSRPQDETWRGNNRGSQQNDNRNSNRGNNRNNNQGNNNRGNDNRGNDNRNSNNQGNNNNQGNRSYRDNERVNAEGRITNISRERNGYRVQLDRGGDSYWVPQSHYRNGGRDLSVGLSVRLGGIFRGGMINVDVVDYPNGGGYNNGGYNQDGYLTGSVDRVDYRSGTLWLRDDRSGNVVSVDTRSLDRRNSRLDTRDLRRGDRVSFVGSWLRNGLFAASGIDSINSGRY